MNDKLLDPVKYYEKEGQRLHEANIRAAFDALVDASGIDVEANRVVVESYDREEAAASDAKAVKTSMIARMVLAILGITGGIAAAAGGGNMLYREWGLVSVGTSLLHGGLILLGIVLACACVLWIRQKILPRLRTAGSEFETHRASADQLYGQAQAQMEPLNQCFDGEAPLRIIEKTLPDFSFDPHFTMENRALLTEHYDFREIVDRDSSVLDTLSGRFAGNSFLFTRRRYCTMGTETYRGKLPIHWTEERRVEERGTDGKMHVRVEQVTRSETLEATVEAPKPCYEESVVLGYGHEAAPDLSFSRSPTHAEQMPRWIRQWKIRSGERKIKRLTEDAVRTGGSFQQLGNTEFDALFGAHDRDHEVQFRMLYTPLAQCNTMALMTGTTGYGDDFAFAKRRRFNTVTCRHMQGRKLRPAPENWRSHSVDRAGERFMQDNLEFFKILYFSFAPLLAIPEYLNGPMSAPGKKSIHASNFPRYEHEAVANAFDGKQLVHPRSKTEAIMRTALISASDGEDLVRVTALSYDTAERVTYRSVRGGDGRRHQVPVSWTEYLPVERTSIISVKAAEDNHRTGSADPAQAHIHGLVGTIIDNT